MQKKNGGHGKGSDSHAPELIPRKQAGNLQHDVERLIRISELHLAADNAVAALESLERAEAIVLGNGKAPSMLASLKLRMADCFRKRGDLSGALERVSTALTIVTDDSDPILLGMALSRDAAIRAGLGDYETALESATGAYDCLRLTTEHSEIGLLELTLGNIHMRSGRVRKSQEFFESALFTFRRIDHREGIARALNNLGILLKNSSRWADARDYLRRALSVSEEAGNYARVANHCTNLGILYTKLCEWELADQHLSRAISIHKEIGNSFSLSRARLAKGHLHRRRGYRELAAAEYAEAKSLSQANAYGREVVLCLEAEGDLLIDAARYDEAYDTLMQGMELAVDVAPDGDLIPELQRRLAHIALAQGNYSDSRLYAGQSARAALNVNDFGEAGAAFRILGEALSREHRDTAAERALRRSIQLLQQTPERYEQSHSNVALARHLAKMVKAKTNIQREDITETVDQLQQAWSFFVASELLDKAAEALADLAEIRVYAKDFEGATRDITRAHNMAEQANHTALIERLEMIRLSLESRSAESALLTLPEVEIIKDWTRIFSESGTAENRMQSMLQFAAERLDSDTAILALPAGENGDQRLVGHIGPDKETCATILVQVKSLLGESGIILATDLGHDPRFTGNGQQLFKGVRSLAALSLGLPEGEGLLYLDRRDRIEPYSRADLKFLSILSGLFSLGLVQVRRERELQRERAGAATLNPFDAYITADPAILQTFSYLERVGDSSASILIMGETGTGKGLLAESIHQAGSRGSGPIISVNCAAIPESLLESELFGHVKGAFTGAHKDKQGLYEVADGGTLFLDEISRASLAVQAKLLHVLDTCIIRRVGANEGREVDVRVICASNANLQEAIQKGEFLEDLFYRLSDFTVQLPPLRERKSDIPLLLDHFYTKVCDEMDRKPMRLSREVKTRLLDHQWRGNIRELIQVIRRVVALSDADHPITADLLPPEFLVDTPVGHNGRNGGSGGAGLRTLKEQLSELECQVIDEALAEQNWNRSRVAKQLGMSYPNLLSKIKAFGLRQARK
jgi:DNA-binding NtrC family response regulator/tetratricopeptide (TPR) repeat protein